jgi:hypothetical protein
MKGDMKQHGAMWMLLQNVGHVHNCSDKHAEDPFNLSMLQKSINISKGHFFSDHYLESKRNEVHTKHHILLADDCRALAAKISDQHEKEVRDKYETALRDIGATQGKHGTAQRKMMGALADTLHGIFDDFHLLAGE